MTLQKRVKKRIKRNLKRILRITKDASIRLILKYKKFESYESFIIFSEARSGSTWLMEILGAILDVSICWEPLHVNYGVVPEEFNFGWRPFIPKYQKDESIISLFDKIHSFKIHSKWTRRCLNVSKLLQSKHVLVKYVRANLLVPFLFEYFEFRYMPIFLIRHPVDVCVSQIKAISDEMTSIRTEVPDWINNNRFKVHSRYLSQLESELEVKIANWCINNCATLCDYNSLKKMYVMYYSDLLLNPEDEIKKYMEVCGLQKDLNNVNFRKASEANYTNTFCSEVAKQLNKNFEFLDSQTKKQIQNVFNHFNFKLYSAYSPLPNKQHLTAVDALRR